MKTFIAIVAALMVVGFSVSVALANPGMLPKHEGYPMKTDGSPVNGQATANDEGRTNQTVDKALTDSADLEKHVVQNLMDENNHRVVASEGAGRLPRVQGPQIVVQPPVTSATKIGTNRVIQ
ncbi:MAG: hypothetical protein ACREII_06740 [Nitrospiraceae bacterium]